MNQTSSGQPASPHFEESHAVPLPRRELGYRSCAGDIELLQDGRLLMCFTSTAGDILGQISQDQGRTWEEPWCMVTRPMPPRAGEEYGHPSLLRLANGQLLLSYIYFAGTLPRFAHTYYRRSENDGETWGSQLILTPFPGTNQVFNDKLVQLPSGRILAPGEREIREEGGDHRGYVSFVSFSDDDGYSWQQSDNVVNTLPVEAQEPHVVPLKDGRLMMLCRTYSGYIVRSYSEDQGVTWSQGEPVHELTLPPNSSALNVKRIPATGDLLLLRCIDGNNRRRTPFASAISRDEGQTWGHQRLIGPDPTEDYGYPSLTFLGDLALLSYHKRDGLHVARINIDWFYGA